MDFGFETFYWFEKTTEGTEDTELLIDPTCNSILKKRHIEIN